MSGGRGALLLSPPSPSPAAQRRASSAADATARPPPLFRRALSSAAAFAAKRPFVLGGSALALAGVVAVAVVTTLPRAAAPASPQQVMGAVPREALTMEQMYAKAAANKHLAIVEGQAFVCVLRAAVRARPLEQTSRSLTLTRRAPLSLLAHAGTSPSATGAAAGRPRRTP